MVRRALAVKGSKSPFYLTIDRCGSFRHCHDHLKPVLVEFVATSGSCVPYLVTELLAVVTQTRPDVVVEYADKIKNQYYKALGDRVQL